MGAAIAAGTYNMGLSAPITHTYNTSQSGTTETIPIGAVQMVVEVWGPSSAGGALNGTGGGGGGGSGGYSKSVISLQPSNWGKTMTVNVGAAGPGTSSSVVAGTFSLTTMTANAGAIGGTGSSGGAGGAGGTATGGTTTNTTGNTGTAGTTGSIGGAGAAGIAGVNGTGNAGGHGANTQTGGGVGLVIIKYT